MDDQECNDRAGGGFDLEESKAEKGATSSEPAISEVASQSFDENVALHRVVTFLNKSLRRRGFIFGLTRERESELRVTIYEVENTKL